MSVVDVKVYDFVLFLFGACLVAAYHDSSRVFSENLPVMCYHDDCSALVPVDACEQLHDAVCRFRIKISGRLVCDYDLRVVKQGACYGYALLLSSR